MEEKDFLKKIETLKKPEVNPQASQKQIKLAIMNAKRSAAWGTWLLLIPVFFFACVTIKEFLGWDWKFAGNFLNWMADLDKTTGFPVISIILFIVLPAIGAIVNLLAIMHFVYDKLTKELIISIKLKWLNIILAVISILVIAVVLLYAIAENSAERAIRRYDVEWSERTPSENKN
jgi:hypothetical protein